MKGKHIGIRKLSFPEDIPFDKEAAKKEFGVALVDGILAAGGDVRVMLKEQQKVDGVYTNLTVYSLVASILKGERDET